jgi:hypothetical protein
MEQEESRGEKRTSGSLFVLARTLHVKKEKEKKTFRSRKLSCFDLIAKEERPGGARKKEREVRSENKPGVACWVALVHAPIDVC